MPQVEAILEGNATVEVVDNVMTITSLSEKTVISYISFNLASGETINFIMPNAGSEVINIVTGGQFSTIQGAINANGMIGLVNTAGIVIANSAQIQAASLLASTLNIGSIDSETIKLNNNGNAPAGVVNAGQINITNGGYAILAGSGVHNVGQIIAEDGTINLAVGDSMTFHLSDSTSVSVTIDEGIKQSIEGLNTAITNQGDLLAHQVDLSAKLSDKAADVAVNNEGIIQATALDNVGGKIVLHGVSDDGSTMIANQGILNASGTAINGKAGKIHIEADTVYNSGASVAIGTDGNKGGTFHMLGDTVINEGSYTDVSGDIGGGEVLIGGEFQGQGDVRRATLNMADQDTVVMADAFSDGDGGRVIFWSDENTHFLGDVYARGGINTGDGGFTEISGKGYLNMKGDVDLTAANGNKGQLLLDPTNILITEFDPTDPGNVGLWFDADDASTITTTGTDVTQWNDKSGNGNHAYQSTASERASSGTSTINGLNTINFDGSGEYMAIDNKSYTGQSINGLSIFSVQRTLSNGRNMILSYDRSETFRYSVGDDQLSHNNRLAFDTNSGSGGGTRDMRGTTGLIGGDGHITGAIFDGTTGNKSLYVDGAQDAASASDGNHTAGSALGNTGVTRYGFIGVGSESNTFDGATGPNNWFHGNIGEILLYDKALNYDETMQVQQYLAAKWGQSFNENLANISVFNDTFIEYLTQTSDVSLQADNNITLGDMSDDMLSLGSRNLTLTATNGTIAFTDLNDTIRSEGGDITFNAGTAINIGHLDTRGASGAVAGGDVTLNGGDSVSFGSINSNNGAVNISNDYNLDGSGLMVVDAALMSTINNGNGDLSFTGEHISLRTDINSGGGNVTLVADQNADGSGYVDINGNRTINTTGGDIYIEGDRLLLDGSGGLIAGAGDITLVDDGATDNEDVRINGAGYTVSGANLTVTSNADFEMINNAAVNMTGTINVTANDDILTNGASLTANGDIDLAANDLVRVRELTSLSNISAVADADNDGVGNLDTYDGTNITTAGGTVTLEGENVTLRDDINSNGGVITLISNRSGATGIGQVYQADGILTSGNANVVMTGGNIYLNGNTGGRIISGTGDVLLTSNGTTDANDIRLINGFRINGRNLVANSTFDFDMDGDSIIDMTNDVTVTAGDDVLAEVGTINATRHIDLRADDLTRVRDVSTTSGNITLISDNDADGTGDFTLYSGTNIDTNGGDLRIEGENIVLNGDIVADGGDIFLIGNRDGAGNGQINFNTDADLNTLGGDLTMQSADFYFNGNTGSSIQTGAGNILITENGSTDANDVYFDNGFVMTGNNLVVNSNHDIQIYDGSTITMTGTIDMIAGDDFVDNTNGSSVNAGSNVTLTAASDVNIENVTSTVGSITLNAGDHVSVGNSLTTNNQLISINADQNLDEVGNFILDTGSLINANGGDIEMRGENVTLNQAINSGGGDVTINANRFAGLNEGQINFNGTASINSAGGDIDLAAADLLLDGAGASIVAGTGNVTLADNGTVDGNDVRFNNGFVLTGNNLVITSNHDIEGYNDSLINMTGTVQMTANDDIIFNDADIRSASDITMNAIDAAQVREVSTTGGNIVINADSDQDGAGNLDTYTGNNISTNGGTITLTGRNVNLRDIIDSNGGQIDITADPGAAVGNGQIRTYIDSGIVSDNGNINLTGGQMYLDGDDGTGTTTAYISSGTGTVTLTDNGTADDNDVYLRDGFTITGNHLNIVGNADLTMRNAAVINMTGNIDIDITGDDIDINTGGGTITAGGNIDMSAADNTVVDQVTSTGGTVTLAAGDAVTLNTGVTTSGGAIQILADNDLNDTGNFTLTSASAIDAGGGDITIRGEHITLNDTIDSNGGDITINANRFAGASNGQINFNAGASVISDNGDIDMSAADLLLDGGAGNTIQAGTGDVTLADNGTNDANDVYINNNFVLTGNNLIITSNHDVTIANDSLINMTGTVNISADDDIAAASGDIRAGGNIDISAVDQIQVREVTSTAGSITIDADSDADGVGNLTTYAGNNITTNGFDIMLRGENVTVQDNLTSNGGNISVLANRNNAGDGDINFAGAGFTIASSGGTISLQGSDLRLDAGGNINSGGGDINLTDNGVSDSYDVYLDGITLTGRNITMNSNHDIQMVNGASINATGAVIGTAGDEVLFDVGDVTAVGDITLNADRHVVTRGLTTTTGDIEISADHDNDSNGNFTFGAGDSMSTSGGNITVYAENLNIQENLTSSGGDIRLEANRDGAGAGTFDMANDADITTGNGDLYIQGHEILLDAGPNSDINAGTGDITIVENGLTDSNDVRMNQVDIIARNVDITSNHDIDMVNGSTITASGDVTFTAGDDINTNAGSVASTGGNIQFDAARHITVDDLTTNGGNITLEADDDTDGFGNINVANGDVLTTNGGNLTALGENVTFGADVNTGGGDITFAANRNNDGFGTFDMAYGNRIDYISGGGDINLTGAEVLLRSNTLGSTIQAGAGDVNITDNNGNGANDVYMYRGIQVSGRDINITSAGDVRMGSNSPVLNATRDVVINSTASLQMDNGSSINTGRNFYSTAGTTSNVRDIVANGNLGVVSGGDINVYNTGLRANGSAGWNGAADETMIVNSTGGGIYGSGFVTTGAGNTRLQAGNSSNIGGTRVVQVNNVQASGDLGIYATGTSGGISIGIAGTSSIAGDLTATGINGSNFFSGTSGDITIETTSGDINTAMIWGGDDITLNANNGSIIQNAAKYGAGYNNNKTIYAGNDITLIANGGAGSYINAGLVTLNRTGAVVAQASGQNGGGRSVQLNGTAWGDLSASGIGGGATTGDVWLGSTLGADTTDLNDTDFVLDVLGNTYVNSGGDVHLYGGFGATGSATIYGQSLDANIDKWDFSINDINISGAGGINIKTHRGSILGNAVRTTHGAASVVLEAGVDPIRDKTVHVDLNSLNTNGNLTIEVTGSTTGGAGGSSVDITAGSVGGATTVTDEAGGATVGTVNTP